MQVDRLKFYTIPQVIASERASTYMYVEVCGQIVNSFIQWISTLLLKHVNVGDCSYLLPRKLKPWSIVYSEVYPLDLAIFTSKSFANITDCHQR